MKTTNYTYAVRIARRLAVYAETLFQEAIPSKKEFLSSLNRGFRMLTRESVNLNGALLGYSDYKLNTWQNCLVAAMPTPPPITVQLFSPQVNLPTPSPHSLLALPPLPAVPQPYSMPLSELIDKYCQCLIDEKSWQAKTKDENLAIFEILLRVVGDVPLSTLTQPKPHPHDSEIKKALDVLCGHDAVVELRAIHKRRKRTDAGYFDGTNRAALVSAAVKLNKEDAAIYITLNPVDPQLLGRYNNRIEQFASSTATDANVTNRRWLLVDIDPIRPKDTAATDEQVEQAKQKGREVFSYLKSCGWAEPVVAESGNGLHLLYRVDLPNDDQSRDLIKGILNALADRFDDGAISIDRSVFNAARIIKLHGTIATKGDHTPSNPWRLSKIITVPESINTVSYEQLRALVPVRLPETPRQRPTINASFRLEDFLSRLAIPYQVDMHSGRERYKLDYCPFNQDHGKGDAAIFREASGALGFKCQHNGCADKTWQDVRALTDGPVEDRRREPWSQHRQHRGPWGAGQPMLLLWSFTNFSASTFHHETTSFPLGCLLKG